MTFRIDVIPAGYEQQREADSSHLLVDEVA
jgi:hypothetical protein